MRSPAELISQTVPSASTLPNRCGSLAGVGVTTGWAWGRGVGLGPGRGPGRVGPGSVVDRPDALLAFYVISGLGISAKATSAAIAGLPADVTLAFAPYDDDVQRWVSEARRQGHEVLLELPMEPYDFPDSDPGPHTLRAGVGEESNTQRLTWSLTRFTGYAGVTNLLGGRFLGDHLGSFQQRQAEA